MVASIPATAPAEMTHGISFRPGKNLRQPAVRLLAASGLAAELLGLEADMPDILLGLGDLGVSEWPSRPWGWGTMRTLPISLRKVGLGHRCQRHGSHPGGVLSPLLSSIPDSWVKLVGVWWGEGHAHRRCVSRHLLWDPAERQECELELAEGHPEGWPGLCLAAHICPGGVGLWWWWCV